MEKNREIQLFFDEMSIDRDQSINNNPIYFYEQLMRQQAVFELLDPHPGECILDVGAGNLRDSKHLFRKRVKVYSIDVSAGMILEGLRNIQLCERPLCAQSSALALPFPSQSFDKIFCSEVIEHIPGYEAVFSEFYRCLKSNGVLVITTPNWNSLYGLNRKMVEAGQRLVGLKPWRNHPYDNWKYPKELEDGLRKNGFEIQRWIGICYLPGFTFNLITPKSIQKVVIRITRSLEPRLRLILAKYGYGIGVQAIKA